MQFTITRERVPPWHGDGLSLASCNSGPWEYPAIGLHRVLAAPHSGEALPAFPARGMPHEQSIAYWSCPMYLMRYSLGWARPDLGLKWWYDAGKPVDDPRLQLLADVWDVEGCLDLLAAQIWTGAGQWANETLSEICGYEPDDEVTVDVDPRWRREQEQRASGLEWPPFTGGSDPLHLANIAFPLWPDADDSPAGFVRSPPTERTASLVLDRLIGWYRHLARVGLTLPDIGERSWHVDVFVKPVGWLGTYRRSRVTGLWFSGPHRFHVRGA